MLLHWPGPLADCQNDAPVTIGASYESGEYLVGVIDEASIYNRALSETEIHNLYTAGAAGKCLDSDGDGLPDAWEIRYFGNLLQPASGDPDGDGLTNAEEYLLGYDPTNANTGGSLLADGQKDYDHDGLSNLAEVRTYNSNPIYAYTFSEDQSVTDAEYFFTARVQLQGTPPPPLTRAKGLYTILANGLLQFTVTGDPGAQFDLYFTSDYSNFELDRRWHLRRFYSGIVCDASGTATFTIKPSTEPQGYFIVLAAEDHDGDGLTDGYESFFRYSGGPTTADPQGGYDTDGDGLNDGWEVEYGLDPTDPNGINGSQNCLPPLGCDPDSDGLPNVTEHGQYYALGPWDASYDPRRSRTAGTSRPVVTISDSPVNVSHDVASFTLTRSVYPTSGNPFAQPLPVYYAVGGSLRYTDDYTLSPDTPHTPPDPDGYKRIFIATIPAEQPSVTVNIKLTAGALTQATKTVTIAVTPYGVSVPGQLQAPGDGWAYVVDWKHNRATFTFAADNPLEMPAVGDNYTRVITQTLLELVRITPGGFDLFLYPDFQQAEGDGADLPTISGNVVIGRYALLNKLRPKRFLLSCLRRGGPGMFCSAYCAVSC